MPSFLPPIVLLHVSSRAFLGCISHFFFFDRQRREYINHPWKRVHQSICDVNKKFHQASKKEREQKITCLYLLWGQPIYKAYYGHGIVIYAHKKLHIIPKGTHKRRFDFLIWLLSVFEWTPISFHPHIQKIHKGVAFQAFFLFSTKESWQLRSFLLTEEYIALVTPKN